MRNSVFATALLVLVLGCGSAWAAGAYNWTGFYAGLNTGFALNDSSYSVSPTGEYLTNPGLTPSNSLRTDSGDFSDSAFTLGGQVGYNFQCGCFVYGVETDFNYNGTDESSYVNRAISPPLIGNFVHTVTQQIDYFGTLRGRFGYTLSDRCLIYATGGLAYGTVSSNSNVLFTSTLDNYIGSSSGLQAGWTIGVGSEYALCGCWSIKLEYLYVDLGSKSYTYSPQPVYGPVTYTTSIDSAQNVFRVGLNYKF